MSKRHLPLFRTRRWKGLRLAILDAANWTCAACGRYGNEVDHLRPLQRGGKAWDRGNLQVLCRACHIEKTRRENTKEPGPKARAWRALAAQVIKD